VHARIISLSFSDASVQQISNMYDCPRSSSEQFCYIQISNFQELRHAGAGGRASKSTSGFSGRLLADHVCHVATSNDCAYDAVDAGKKPEAQTNESSNPRIHPVVLERLFASHLLRGGHRLRTRGNRGGSTSSDTYILLGHLRPRRDMFMCVNNGNTSQPFLYDRRLGDCMCDNIP
jgi:hypothetical protein